MVSGTERPAQKATMSSFGAGITKDLVARKKASEKPHHRLFARKD